MIAYLFVQLETMCHDVSKNHWPAASSLSNNNKRTSYDNTAHWLGPITILRTFTVYFICQATLSTNIVIPLFKKMLKCLYFWMFVGQKLLKEMEHEWMNFNHQWSETQGNTCFLFWLCCMYVKRFKEAVDRLLVCFLFLETVRLLP